MRIILTRGNEILASRYYRGFMNYIDFDDYDLPTGEYLIKIVPNWNRSAESDPAHKILSIDILAPHLL